MYRRRIFRYLADILANIDALEIDLLGNDRERTLSSKPPNNQTKSRQITKCQNSIFRKASLLPDKNLGKPLFSELEFFGKASYSVVGAGNRENKCRRPKSTISPETSPKYGKLYPYLRHIDPLYGKNLNLPTNC